MTDSDDQGLDALVSDIEDILAGEELEEQISFETVQGGIGIEPFPTEEEEEEGSQLVSDQESTSPQEEEDRTLTMSATGTGGIAQAGGTAAAVATTTVTTSSGLTFEVKNVAPPRSTAPTNAGKELKALHSMASRDGLSTDKLEAFFA